MAASRSVAAARALPVLARFRPLDWVTSIKMKLGLIVAGSVIATVGAIYGSVSFGMHARWAFAAGLVVSLLVIQLLAHGMVLPLREMVSATEAMAAGNYSQQVTATARDEVGSLARSFNAMAARLDEAERQRRELVANVSHELRTPVAALRARLENLADGVEELDDDTVTAMLKATERLGRLVDQLLELAQYESGTIRISQRPFAVAEAVDDAIAEAGAARADVRIAAHVDEELSGCGDPERIHEVLTNLLTNAVRHSPAQGVVTVTGDRQRGGIRIAVSDQGPGVPAGEVERIFERFHRTDAARRTGDGGAGLGLAIARSIVDLHGGSIRAESPAAGGLRVVVDLPG
jgi:signal transduction histidine kinase